MKKNVLVILIIGLLAGLAVYQNLSAKEEAVVLPSETAPKPQFLAPSFTLTGMDNQSYSVGEKREKPLLVNFWASWCGPCEAEAPDLMRIYDKLKDKLDIYAVNVTKGDNLKEVKEFLDQYPYPFPVLLDKEGKAAELYQVQVIPTSFLVDRNGVIVDVIHYLPGKELEKKLKEFADS